MFFCVQKASCKRLLNQIDTLPTQPPFEQEISNLISKGAGCRPWVTPPFLRSAISLWFKLHRFCLHQQEYREKWIRSVSDWGGLKHSRIFHNGKAHAWSHMHGMQRFRTKCQHHHFIPRRAKDNGSNTPERALVVGISFWRLPCPNRSWLEFLLQEHL